MPASLYRQEKPPALPDLFDGDGAGGGRKGSGKRGKRGPARLTKAQQRRKEQQEKLQKKKREEEEAARKAAEEERKRRVNIFNPEDLYDHEEGASRHSL